jgi:type IV secretory pathway TrbL component
VTVLWFLCKSWLILFGGFFMTGFIGSNWTRNYWQSYLKAAVGVALQLFMLSLAVLIVGTQWKNPDLWLPKFEFDMSSITAAAASVAGLVITLFERLIATLGVLFFDMVLLIGAPSLGASLASGTINAGLGELIGAASGVLSGGFMMGKAAQAGATAVGQVAKAVGGAGDVAKSATRSSYRESLKNGISGGEGTDGNFKEMAKQQARGAGQDAKANHMKSGISDAGGAFKGSMNEVGKKGSSVASNLSRGSGGGGASAPSVNTNTPHQ